MGKVIVSLPRKGSLLLFFGIYETGRNVCPLQQLLFHSLFIHKKTQDSCTTWENISKVLRGVISCMPMLICKSGLKSAQMEEMSKFFDRARKLYFVCWHFWQGTFFSFLQISIPRLDLM